MKASLPSHIVFLEAYANDLLSFTEALELIAATRHHKRLVRLTGLRSRLDALTQVMHKAAIHWRIAPLHLIERFQTPLGDSFASIQKGEPQEGEVGILFAGEPTTVAAAIEVETNGCAATEAAAIYGYPTCCAVSYKQIQHGRFWVDILLNDIGAVTCAPWGMNRFARLFPPYLSILPDYFPCSLRCEGSIALAKAYTKMLSENGELSGLLVPLEQHLSRPVLHYGGALYQLDCLPLQQNDFTCDKGYASVQVISTWSYTDGPVLSGKLDLEWADNMLHVAPEHPISSGQPKPTHPATCIVFF